MTDHTALLLAALSALLLSTARAEPPPPDDVGVCPRLTEARVEGASRTAGPLTDVHAGPVGWAVGRDGLVLSTRDGGATWRREETPAPAALEAIAYLPSGDAWAVGDQGALWFRGPRGWTSAGIDADARLRGLDFADGAHGLAVGADGLLVRTTNGGQSWLLGRLTPAWDFNAVAAPDPDVRVVVGDDGAWIRSEDGGYTWALGEPFTDRDLHAVAFSNPQRGVAVGEGGLVAWTEDGGLRWTVSALGAPDLRGVDVGEDGAAWIVGDGGTVACMSGPGLRPVSSTLDTREDLAAVNLGPDGAAWVVGAEGLVHRMSVVGEMPVIRIPAPPME
ncbi:MAG: hypothetical protein H6739_34815 [Alphaproteobacteria bacterium]|nr:hypothetical protein [Alphaproteobacteria bacterium]